LSAPPYQRQSAVTAFEVALLDVLAFLTFKVVHGKQMRGSVSIALCNPELITT
jgi:hypothetical protein